MRSLLLSACVFAYSFLAVEQSAKADPRAMAMQGAWLQAKLQNQTVSTGGMSFPSWSPWAAKAQAVNMNMNRNVNPQPKPIARQQAQHRELCLRAAWLNKQRPPSTAALDKCAAAGDKTSQNKCKQDKPKPGCDAPSGGQPGRLKICVPTAIPVSRPGSSPPLKKKHRGLGPTHYTPPKNQPPPRQSTLIALELLKMEGLNRAQQCWSDPGTLNGFDL